VWNDSPFKQAIENGEVGVAPPLDLAALNGGEEFHVKPYLVGDAAFGLSPSLTKSFPNIEGEDEVRAERAQFNEALNVIGYPI
jgi:hypothetical protein